MISKKKTLSLFIVILMVGSLLIVSKPIYAASNGSGGGNVFSDLIQYISQKFGLNKTQVKSAIQDFRQEKKATITPRPTMTQQEKQAAEKKRLDNLVNQGKITSDQEAAILSELESLWTKYQIGPNTTLEQKKKQMQAMQTELKAWALSQKIDSSFVIGFLGFGRGMGEGRGGGWRGSKNLSPTP